MRPSEARFPPFGTVLRPTSGRPLRRKEHGLRNDASRASLRHTREGVPRSELDLLRERQGIIDFDPEVTDGALDLGMSGGQLDRSQIAGLTVDLRRLSTAHRMCAIGAAVHPGAMIQPCTIRAYWRAVT